jgi:hypothetical protein
MGTHKHNMEKEDSNHIFDLASEFPHVKFVIYEVVPDPPNTLQFRQNAYWHNIARIAGWRSLPCGTDWVLFIDSDEIPDAALFTEWFASTKLDPNVAYNMANYWYFREPTYQAKTFEDSVLLVHTSSLSFDRLMRDMERIGIVADHPTIGMVGSLRGKPMFHHYSWVRSKDDMKKKAATWGHKGEQDWDALIEAEFSRGFNGTDFVHGYIYTRVPNFFGITLETHEV